MDTADCEPFIRHYPDDEDGRGSDGSGDGSFERVVVIKNCDGSYSVPEC